MAFTVTFRNSDSAPSPDAVEDWLTELGEPLERVSKERLALKALPIELLVPAGGQMQAQLGVTPVVPLQRVVDLLFSLSVRAGADVRLTGHGSVIRPQLWVRLADEQDRLRIAEALERADERGNHAEVVNQLWQVLAALRPGADVRWDAAKRRVVELKEVGQGISIEDASWHDEAANPGDTVAVPVEGYLCIPAWRWLSEAHPGLAEVRRS